MLSAWNDFFVQAEQDHKVIALVGNHDYSGKYGGNHALEVFYNLDIKVIDEPQEIDGITYIPFVRDDSEFEDFCRNLPDQKVLVCHQSFNNADFGNGFREPFGVKTECVKHLKAVISGHIHKRQAFDNIWYPGVPFQHSFADAHYEPRVFIIDLTYTGYQIIKECNLNMPRFVVIKESIENLLDALPNPHPTTSYKLASKGTPAEIVSFWKERKAQLFKKGSRRIVDAIVPEKGEIKDELFKEYETKREKLEAFIRNKRWRTSADSLITAARTICPF